MIRRVCSLDDRFACRGDRTAGRMVAAAKASAPVGANAAGCARPAALARACIVRLRLYADRGRVVAGWPDVLAVRLLHTVVHCDPPPP